MPSVGSYWKPVAIGGAILGGIGALVLVTRKTAPVPPPRRIALIGDSYAVGLGPELARLFPDFRFEGHKGTNTSQWASHAKACGTCGDWITGFKPDVVLVSLGTNDGVAPNPKNYQTIVSRLHGIGARVVWIEPPAGVQNVDAVRRIIASLGVSTVPATTTPIAASDPLHLHPQSYVPWSREIAQAVS
jgi:lysophospholipase L1-like esterase